jgi:hypothetical protein
MKGTKSERKGKQDVVGGRMMASPGGDKEAVSCLSTAIQRRMSSRGPRTRRANRASSTPTGPSARRRSARPARARRSRSSLSVDRRPWATRDPRRSYLASPRRSASLHLELRGDRSARRRQPRAALVLSRVLCACARPAQCDDAAALGADHCGPFRKKRCKPATNGWRGWHTRPR